MGRTLNLVTAGMIGLAGCSYEPSFSGVYLNSPIVDGYDITIDSRNLRIGNLRYDNNSREGFTANVLYVQGDFNSDTVRIDEIQTFFPRGHDLERFVSREELERVVREIKVGN